LWAKHDSLKNVVWEVTLDLTGKIYVYRDYYLKFYPVLKNVHFLSFGTKLYDFGPY